MLKNKGIHGQNTMLDAAVYPIRKFVTPKVRALVDYLVSVFPDAL
ncbi:hypothetical protein [Marinobacter sp. es.048]|nr:hypothetical protein [Marinobacter sp. es.048]